MTWVRVWRLLAVLALPAIPLHELTHAAVAWPWADVRIEWRDDVAWYLQPALRVEMTNWSPHAPTWAMLGAYVAPFVVGYAIAAGFVTAVLLGYSIQMSVTEVAVLGVNWIWFTGASVADFAPVVARWK